MAAVERSSVVWAIRLYLAAAAGWLIWGWIEYAGPFKWAAEWQLEQFGSYGLKLTLLVPLLVLCLPAVVVGQRLGVMDQVFGPLRAAASGPHRRWAGRLALLALLPLMVGAAAGAWYAAPHAPPTTGTLDLLGGNAAEPAADLVDVVAVMQSRHGVSVTSSGSAGDRHTYVPLTGPSWTPRDRVRFVLDRNDRPGGAPLLVEPGGVVRIAGAGLERDGLPGLVREEFKRDLALADTVYVVRPGAEPGEEWLMAAFGGGLMGMVLLLAAAILGVIEFARGRRGG